MLVERTINKRLVEEVMRIATFPLDLEQDMGVEEACYETVDPETIECLMEFNNPETLLEEDDLKRTVQDVLDSLTPREAKVLKMRFGIGIDKDYSLEEVGKQFDVSRERIRQIEAKALRKMRHSSRSDKLKTFLGADGERITFSIFNEPFPDIDNFWGIESMARYSDATEGWNKRRIAASARIEELRARLKKGTLT
jgi:RNA polymerase sigma factor (sigma-70 family)